MVIYEHTAIDDLDRIVEGLNNWKKIKMTVESILKYVDELKEAADTICKSLYHADCRYKMHKRKGKKVFSYKRNRNTTWYVIYDWDNKNKIAFVNAILSNYETIAGLI